MNIPMYDSNPNNVGALVTAQVERVEADGGKIIDVDYIEGMLATLVELGLMDNVKFLGDANFGVKKDAANAVSKLYDLSGNNNDVVQATGANQPVWTKAVQGGRAGLVFDGTDILTLTLGSALSQPNTVFAVFKDISGAGVISIFDGPAGSRHALQRIVATENWRIYAGGTINGPNGHSGVTPTLASIVFNGISSGLFISGVSEASGDIGIQGLGGFWIGADDYGGRMTGNIYSSIVINAALTTSQRTAIETYLNAYFAIY